MRYFWHAIIAITLLAAAMFAFFFLSIQTKNHISYTDELPTLSAPEVTIADPSLGPATARVTIVDFGDYACPSCKSVDSTLTELSNIYPNDLRIIWKDMPNTSAHPEALNAAMAARCAAKQDSSIFFLYHDNLFANQGSLGTELYSTLATQLGLKAETLTNCLTKQDTLPLVQRTYEEGLALKISATPTIFINGARFTGTLAKSDINAAIKAALR